MSTHWLVSDAAFILFRQVRYIDQTPQTRRDSRYLGFRDDRHLNHREEYLHSLGEYIVNEGKLYPRP